MPHIHKFKRHTFKKRDKTTYDVFFCVNNCTYQVKRELALGKESACWRCGQPFPMNEYSLRLAKPHCPDCQTDKHGVPKAVKVNIKLPENLTNDKPEVTKSISIGDDLRERLLASVSKTLKSGVIGTKDTDDDLL